jgi:hypothetical protein
MLSEMVAIMMEALAINKKSVASATSLMRVALVSVGKHKIEARRRSNIELGGTWKERSMLILSIHCMAGSIRSSQAFPFYITLP